MAQTTEHASRSSCPLACTLDVIGDHWSLLVIRDLMFLGRHEYKDMLNAEEGISTNILSDRLKRLEAGGLIDSIPHPESGRRKLYYLLPKGKDLVHVLTHMARWANQHLSPLVRIPPEKRALLVNKPDKLIEITLQQLDEWEKQFLKKKNKKG
ncbi:MAG: helix-turn-helix domain-containing protein [Nitrospirae bacterium]|nr:helix-turn-helix domain-containing protein [Nitrospirota bacterium]MDA1303274.1 helix-turn-helix domain-containing protein [Nitrospirota bacterium]